MGIPERTELRTYSTMSFSPDSVIKICDLPGVITRETAPDLDVFLRQQLFHALVDPLDVPGILPLAQDKSSYRYEPEVSDTRHIELGFDRAKGESLHTLSKPLRAHDVARVMHAATHTFLSLKQTIETAYPGQIFSGHGDLKPDCFFINGTVTILDWQTYDISPAVPTMKHHLLTPNYSSLEHLQFQPTEELTHDVVSMAKIMLHGILGDRAFPKIHIPKKKKNLSAGQTIPIPDTRSIDPELTTWESIEEHTVYCIDAIDNIVSGVLTKANKWHKHTLIHPARVDAQPDVLLLIRNILRRDIMAWHRPEDFTRMPIIAFAEELNSLDPLYPVVTHEVRTPSVFEPMNAVFTQPHPAVTQQVV